MMSNPGMLDIQIDTQELTDWADRLKDVDIQTEVVEPFWERLATVFHDILLRFTPVKSGQLAASYEWVVQGDAPQASLLVWNVQPYAFRWIEWGFRDDPRFGRVFMKVRPGGYRAFEKAIADIMPRILDIKNDIVAAIFARMARSQPPTQPPGSRRRRARGR